MKLIRIFIAFVVVSLVVGVGSAFNGKYSKPKPINPNQSTEIVENENLEDKKESEIVEQEETGIVEEKNAEILQESEAPTSTDNSLKSSTENKNTKKEGKKVDIKTPTEPKEGKQPAPPVALPQPTAWEQLGISEYDYYNSPMLKWQKVTHSNYEDCQKDGNKATELKTNPETGEQYQEYYDYWCYGVNSYSGRTLGVMLKLS